MHRRGRIRTGLFVFMLFLLSRSTIYAQNNYEAALVITSSNPYPVWGKCCLVECSPYINECSVTTQESCQQKGGSWAAGGICGTCVDPC